MFEAAKNMANSLERKKYALIGTGGRSSFFYSAIATTYKATSVMVALCDTIKRASTLQTRNSSLSVILLYQDTKLRILIE
jgi:hypothetical protein